MFTSSHWPSYYPWKGILYWSSLNDIVLFRPSLLNDRYTPICFLTPWRMYLTDLTAGLSNEDYVSSPVFSALLRHNSLVQLTKGNWSEREARIYWWSRRSTWCTVYCVLYYCREGTLLCTLQVITWRTEEIKLMRHEDESSTGICSLLSCEN